MPVSVARTRARFPPLDTAVDLEDAPPCVLGLLAERWMADLAPADHTPSSFLLRWTAGGGGPAPSSGPAATKVSRVRWRPTPAGGTLSNRAGRLLWAAAAPEATVELVAGPYEPSAIEPLVEAALGLALASSGVCFQHAAAMNIGGRRLLVTGASGAGKSTLAAATLVASGTVVSDDSLLLGWHQDRPLALAARRDLWLRAAAGKLLLDRGEGDLRPQRQGDGRLRLRRDRGADRLRRHLEPDVLINLHRDLRLRGYRVERLSQARALAALIRNTSALYLIDSRFGPEQTCGPRNLLGLLAAIAERLPAVEVRLGPRLIREPEGCLADLVAELPAAPSSPTVGSDTGAELGPL